MSDSSHDATDRRGMDSEGPDRASADEPRDAAAQEQETTETPHVPNKPVASPTAASESNTAVPEQDAPEQADSGSDTPTARFAPGWNDEGHRQSHLYGSGPQAGSGYSNQGPPHTQHGSAYGPGPEYGHAGPQPGSRLGDRPQGIPYPQPPQAAEPPQPRASSSASAFGQGATWRSALIPPGLALLAGIIVSVIISLLLASIGNGEFSSLAEDTGFNTDGVSYALPFVLLALSLFGSAVFRFNVLAGDMGQTSGSLYASGAPLLITVVVIGVLWWLTKRSELKSPSQNRGATWIRIGITTVSTALVLLLLELIFAARFSITDSGGAVNLEFSAVTVRSFFLPLLAILVTSICARVAGHFKGTEAIGAPFLRWLVPPVLATWTHLVVATLALSVVAIFVIPLTLDMPWQTIPVLLVNVGLILTMLVHLGGVTASAPGEMMGYDSGGFSESLTIFSREAPGQLWIGLFVVLAAVLAATMVATVTRRPSWTVVGEDKQQWTSAWRIPVAFCGMWGLLSVLAVPLRLHLEGSAAAATMFDSIGVARAGVGPLAWSFLVFALWGVGIEVLSRTLGPRLVLTVPAVAKFLAGRAVHPHWGQALGMSEPRLPLIHPDAVNRGTADARPADGVPTYSDSEDLRPMVGSPGGAYIGAGAPPPPGAEIPPGAVPVRPFDRKKATLIGVISGSAVVVIVAALIVVTQVNGHVFGPEAAVEKYFSELSDGDAEGALEMADVDVPVEQRQLLTNDVLSASKALPQDVTVEDAEVNGNSATVSATYDLGGSKSTTSFSLHKAGKKALLFDEWSLQAPELFSLSVETPGLSTVKVNGIDVDTDGSQLTLPAFPGMYSVGLADESELVSADEIETRAFFADDADMEGAEPALLAAEPTEAFRAEVDKQVKTLIDSCAKKTVAQPDGCPFGSYSAESYDATNIKWSISSYPTVSVTDDSSGGGYFDPEESTGPNGGSAWPIITETTGEAFVTGKYDSFFDDSDAFDDTVTFSVDGTAEIVDGKVVINVEGDPYGF